MSEILSGLVSNLGFYKMLQIINIYSRFVHLAPLLSPVTYPLLRLTWHRLQEHVLYSLGFPEGRVIVPFLRRRPQVFPRVKVIMNLKWLVVLLDNKLSVIRLYLSCFLIDFYLRGKMTDTISSSLRSFHIYRKWNGRRECKVLYEEEETVYSTCVFLWISWKFQENLLCRTRSDDCFWV